MKRLLLIGMIIAAMAVPFVSSAQVEVANGTMQIGAKIKFMYASKAEDDKAIGAGAPGMGQVYGFDGTAVDQFITQSVEVDIAGVIGENVSYIIELQASAMGTSIAAGPVGGLTGITSSQGEVTGGAVGVRQAAITITDLIPSTTILAGLANLPVSNYQVRATNDYDLILLPILNTAGPGVAQNSQGAYAPMGLGWQVSGAGVIIAPVDMLEIGIGFWNGYANGNPNANVDPTGTAVDLELASVLGLTIRPSETSSIGIAYISEGWQEDLAGAGTGTEQQLATTYVLSGAMATDQLELTLDYVMGTVEDYTMDPSNGKIEDLEWMGYQVTVGFWVTDGVEILARYETFDPDTLNESVTGGPSSEDDALTATTIGLNMLLADNAELAINYVMLDEEGSDIDITAGEVGGEYQALDNDTILVQLQVWQ